MSILIDENTRVIVQGITGKMARAHTRQMLEYGTQVVGGVVPGKGGESVHGVPVFDTVEAAVQATSAQASVIFVPPPFAADSMMEATEAGIGVCTCITEGIPAQDMIRVKRYMYRAPKARRMVLTGPNCAGIISPGKALLGVMPEAIYTRGDVGIISRSGTLGYEAAAQLTAVGIGISTAVGIGGDPINGSSFRDMLERFEADDETRLVVIIGEVGGAQEEDAADFIRNHMSKPVVAHLVGIAGQRAHVTGHAGAILSAFSNSEADKVEFLTSAGVTIEPRAAEIGKRVRGIRDEMAQALLG